MESFYRSALTRKRTDPAAELRRAKLDMIERLRREHGQAHPQVWGAFIVSGR
jgi:CHAT domain-containing protein